LEPAKPAFTVPPEAEKICRACPDARGCPNVTVCCGGQVDVMIVAPCPKGRW
jgi:hypothetical protein